MKVLARGTILKFTTIEFYQAYATYFDLMDLSEELLRTLVMQVFGQYQFTYQGQHIDLAEPFRRVSIARLVGEFLKLSPQAIDELEAIKSVEEALRLCKGHTVTADEPIKICLKELSIQETAALVPNPKSVNLETLGKAIDAALESEPARKRRLALHLLYAVFEHRIEHTLIQPTFLLDFPVSVSPLARKRDSDPAVVDRFELFMGGFEIANAFSELTDPIDQRERFEAQARHKAQGDEEAQDVDEDFLRALEVGMPPTAGEGIGIDRLVMLLTDSASIREVILFPKLKSEGH